MKRARKKKKKNEPADKNTVCSDKSIQVCNFYSVFQTLLKSDFIDAVNTPEIHFPPKIFSKIQVRFIRKCWLYTPVYGRPRVTRVEVIDIETYPGWLELPLIGTNFHGPKPVRATEVLLYIEIIIVHKYMVELCPFSDRHFI